MQSPNYKTEIACVSAEICRNITANFTSFGANSIEVSRAKAILNDPNWEVIGLSEDKYAGTMIYFKRFVEGQYV